MTNAQPLGTVVIIEASALYPLSIRSLSALYPLANSSLSALRAGHAGAGTGVGAAVEVEDIVMDPVFDPAVPEVYPISITSVELTATPRTRPMVAVREVHVRPSVDV